MKCSLGISNFLEEISSLSHSVVSSISLHWLLRKAFLSLLAILWNSVFRCLYLSISPLLFSSLLFTAICKASPDSHFAVLHLFSMGMVLIPVSCTMSRTSVHSSSGTQSIRSSPSMLKSKDITLPTKVRLVKAMVFPVVIYGCESWTVKKPECWRMMLWKCGAGEDSCESLGL